MSFPLLPLLRSLRPSHWLKNSFLLAPAVFGLRLFQRESWPTLAAAFSAFCLAASATYLVNDLADCQRDRENPRTRGRPIASGELAPPIALAAALLLTLAALALAWWGRCLVPLLAYVAASHAYTFFLKKLPLADVATLTLLYLLRLLAGAEAVAVPPSPWLLLCGGLLALLLSLGKRLEKPDGLYAPSLLRAAVSWLTAAVACAYMAYALRPVTWEHFSPFFPLTAVPVLVGLARYRSLALAGKADPVAALFSDLGMQLAALGWGASVLLLASLAG